MLPSLHGRAIVLTGISCTVQVCSFKFKPHLDFDTCAGTGT
jgi:hypothetical protein